MLDTTIILIKPGEGRQDYEGVWRDDAQTTREVFARMESVNQSEFFAGGQSGFRPEMRFTVFQAEYQGEPTLTWNGEAYAIYRTYQKPDTDDLELYVKREVGVHGGSNQS